ncbi:hypothetical protein [Halostella sp. PRR32]|uniref:hypothetical protein n=1 Tax=Halostella sp. PRR32 TaxID=3098147 RepID=UPI002B1E3AE6|nr:hypothetical protein [Halostella sp. PRR32]
MNSNLIDCETIGDLDDVEDIVGDDTIGRAVLAHGEEHEGDMLVDTRRLRRLLLAYEERHGERYVWVSTRESPNGMPALTMQDRPEASDILALVGRVPTESYPPEASRAETRGD